MPAVLRTQPWWLAPGPIALAALVAVASGAFLYEGVKSTPLDPRVREQKAARGSAFCDIPSRNAGQPIPAGDASPTTAPAR